jgi:hypothetical protein
MTWGAITRPSRQPFAVIGIACALCAVAVSLNAAAGLTFTAPDGWKQGRPGSSMRVAEFTLPRAAGDTEDAQLVVYYFGGQGGSVDANIQRWLAQIEQPDGKPTSAVARKESRTVNGLHVTLVDATGTYVAQIAPGAGERHNQPHFRLRAGVVQTANGPYFLKLTGPQATVTKWNDAFDRFVASLRYAADH